MRRWQAVLFLIFLLIADQASKLFALVFLDPNPDGTAVRIWRGVLYLKLFTNPGGIWGALSGLGPVFFIVLSAAVAAFVALLLVRLRGDDRAYAAPLVLLLGGFIGNGIDRVRLGHVVEFIYVTWYPRGMLSTFNLSDLAILAGLIWIIGIWTIRRIRGRGKAAAGSG